MSTSTNPNATTTTTTQTFTAPLNKANYSDVNNAALMNGTVNSHIFLSPIAAPSILGFISYAIPAVILGCRLAQWYGTSSAMIYIWPMLLIFGIVQLLCAMFSYLARDNLATAFNGIWGSFWLAYGVLLLFVAEGVLPLFNDGHRSAEIAIWWAVVAAITFALFLGSFAHSFGTVLTTAIITVASVFASIAYFHGAYHILKVAGWLLFFSGLMAFYAASAWLLEYQFMRPILPFNNFNMYNRMGFLNRGMLYDPVVINRGLGEPGVMKGQ